MCCVLSCSAGQITILLKMCHTIGLRGDGETQCCIKTFDTLNKQYDFGNLSETGQIKWNCIQHK